MLAQSTAPSIESLATQAANGDPVQAGTYREFLVTANQAHRLADDNQRALMRQLANTCPTPAEATAGIRQIMNW